jgi:hypothetical protein
MDVQRQPTWLDLSHAALYRLIHRQRRANDLGFLDRELYVLESSDLPNLAMARIAGLVVTAAAFTAICIGGVFFGFSWDGGRHTGHFL